MKNDSIRFLDDIQSSFKKMKVLTVTTVVSCAAICCVVALGAFWFALQQRDQIYVLDQGAVLSAFRADNQAQRDLEVENHVTRFHELFYNVAPNPNAINENTEKAFNLADASARTYFNDLSEAKFYSHLIQVNATQQISVDSIHVNMSVVPYRVRTFATRYIIRETNMTKYEMETTCEVIESVRSSKNPHGLIITKFNVEKDQPVKTIKR